MRSRSLSRAVSKARPVVGFLNGVSVVPQCSHDNVTDGRFVLDDKNVALKSLGTAHAATIRSARDSMRCSTT